MGRHLQVMTILPLVERELRVTARSPSCYWLRFAAALAGILVCLPALTMYAGWGLSPAQMGTYVFNNLVLAAFVLCCVSGFMTVDGISRERREGTLGLLFLTRVRVVDVLLGKFGAAALAGLCALAACAPVITIPILSGGVSGGEAARKVLVLFDTMILSLTAGLWASARDREWWSCARAAGLVLLALVFGPLLLEAMSSAFSRHYVAWLGPLSALAAAEDSSYRRSAGSYWISLVVIHAISWLLVIGAGIRMRRALREEDETPVHRGGTAVGRKVWSNFTLANIKIKFPGHKPLAEGEEPLAWLMRGQSGIRMLVWAGALLGVIYQSGLFIFGALVRRAWGAYSFFGMGVALRIAEGCLFAWAVGRFFIEARRGGELELLMTTPEGATNMVASQWKWLKNVFWWPTVAMVAASVFWTLTTLFFPYQRWGRFGLYIVSSQLTLCVSTIAGMVALVWVGMWYGWSERSQTRAIIRTVLLAKGPPYLIGMLGSMVIQRMFPVRYLNSQFSVSDFLVWNSPQIIVLLYCFCLYCWARRRLESALAPRLPKSGLDSLLNFIYQPG